MANSKLYSIRDLKVNAFAPPMHLQTEAQARRLFSTEVNRKDEKNMLYLHPEDYDLYYHGEFDEEQGTFNTLSVPVLVCNGAQLKSTE